MHLRQGEIESSALVGGSLGASLATKAKYDAPNNGEAYAGASRLFREAQTLPVPIDESAIKALVRLTDDARLLRSRPAHSHESCRPSDTRLAPHSRESAALAKT
jgi:hypothetical protein